MHDLSMNHEWWDILLDGAGDKDTVGRIDFHGQFGHLWIFNILQNSKKSQLYFIEIEHQPKITISTISKSPTEVKVFFDLIIHTHPFQREVWLKLIFVILAILKFRRNKYLPSGNIRKCFRIKNGWIVRKCCCCCCSNVFVVSNTQWNSHIEINKIRTDSCQQ